MKGHHSLLLLSWQKQTNMLKFLWPFLILNSRILRLIWRGKTFFCSISHNHFCTWRNSTNYKWDAGRGRPILWRQTKNLETQNVSYLSLFTIWHNFGIISPFEKKLVDCNVFPVDKLEVRIVRYFPPSEIWFDWSNSNFRRASRFEAWLLNSPPLPSRKVNMAGSWRINFLFIRKASLRIQDI